jgi:hypothetical protein
VVWVKLGWLIAPAILLLPSLTVLLNAQGGDSPLRFEVTLASSLSQKLGGQAQSGRLFVILGRNEGGEPRLAAGRTGMDAPPMFARDATVSVEKAGVIDASCAAFPLGSLNELKAGTYSAQAVLDTNRDLKGINSPGNLYSKSLRVQLDPRKSGVVKLQLMEQVPAEQLPAETEYVKYVKLQSELLSKFWGRPIYLRAGVVLPRDFEREPERRYPVWVMIGGFGSRYTGAARLARDGMWLADATPRMIAIQLDGAGPYGDPYQVNSDNNGPYGDAITQELIPFIEKKYRGIGAGHARFLSGGSTGGWVALALQTFYPDYFNGAWSFCADGVDFRGFQLINIYEDKNAYENRHGFERPGMRDLDGDVIYTVRHECQMENVLGSGDSWAQSGGQWGAWNATYGPRGADGWPVPLWEPKTGEINRAAVEHWKKYDLRMVLEQNWPTLAPKLRGKLHIWMGTADNYFLDKAMRLMEGFLNKAQPPYEGKLSWGTYKGHCWRDITDRQMMDQMMAALEQKAH